MERPKGNTSLQTIKYKDDIINFYLDGHSLTETAKKFNLSLSGVRSFLGKNRIAIRTRKEGQKLLWDKRKNDKNYLSRFRKRASKGQPIILVIDGKNILEHHKVWLDYHKLEKIPDGFVIHHIDHNQSNNDIKNLILVHDVDHRRLHSGGHI